MRKEKVLSYYGDTSDYELSTIGGRVYQAMQEPLAMAAFPNPNPTLIELETLVQDFVQKHEVASRGGSTLQNGVKKESRDALLAGLTKLANHVNEQAKGEISKLLCTGLHLAASASTSQLPTVVLLVKPTDGRVSGHILLGFKSVKTAWEYEIAIGVESEAGAGIDWIRTQNTTSSRANLIHPVTPGVRYFFRVRARNGKGFGDWSETASLIAR